MGTLNRTDSLTAAEDTDWQNTVDNVAVVSDC